MQLPRRSFLSLALCQPALAGEMDDALVAYQSGSYDLAREIWERLAAQGNADAQYRLGYMYVQQKGVGITENAPELVKWMKLATANGHCRAPFWVGFEYALGLYYGPFNWDASVKWFRIGAERGDPDAQSYLAGQYDRGEGVLQDYVEAARWYKLAAEQGDESAQETLAGMYEEGRGVRQDLVLAHKWYNISTIGPVGPFGNPNERRRKKRDALAAKMTASQVAEAHRLAREWKPTPSPCAQHYPREQTD